MADNTKPERRSYDPATKQAVIAALLAGQGVDELARAYQIPEGTVKSWRQHAMPGGRAAAIAGSPKREQIGELLVDYLHSTLTTLKAQQAVFRDREWLKSQNAADLAVLHGVLTDKSIRLLEALGGAGPLTDPNQPALTGEPVAVIEAPDGQP